MADLDRFLVARYVGIDLIKMVILAQAQLRFSLYTIDESRNGSSNRVNAETWPCVC